MDQILKSFSIGFLLRSMFAGVFFILSFCKAAPGAVDIKSATIFSLGLPFALIAGVTVYGLHRAFTYPLFEWAANAKWAKKLRDTKWTLVSDNAINNFSDRWNEKSETGKDKLFQRGQQISVWADYVHLQYASALCIIVGAWSGDIVSDSKHSIYWPLFWLAVIFVLGAMISHWRLHSVMQHLPEIEENKT